MGASGGRCGVRALLGLVEEGEAQYCPVIFVLVCLICLAYSVKALASVACLLKGSSLAAHPAH